ncbi:uncharacterized protein BCR38DRAFT_459125 [Pseudomassariella vexata]|uniref:Enoyl reductase (ER) domain-containing protein n=1 Tax=Pseudomassariella vexata TaxID=1141098 RepID=A0A1Y2DTU4_9PEZI|nr:uncharacterized protein BCR38DRAFT_459125 [Pseudomassariella vexata]ORY62680.1 hypothetical protein BCR38DRAFT_459125 [Pseudomassariella vexata]
MKEVTMMSISLIPSSIPPPSVTETQVAPLYSGFSGADINMRNGTYPFQRKTPLTPGYCLVGRVVQSHPSSSSSTRLRPGRLLVLVPADLDPKLATAIILDWATAYGMVHRAATVQKGRRVFIHGLSGAVGNATLQLCQTRGALVYGTASARNHDSLRAQGAAEVFVYTDKQWISEMKPLGGVHAVFDPLGFESWDESYSILSEDEEAVLVGYGGNLQTHAGANGEGRVARSQVPPTMKLLARNAMFWTRRRTSFYYISRDRASYVPGMLALFEIAGKGEIDVKINKIWEMEQIREAHENYAGLRGVGSILIKMSE